MKRLIGLTIPDRSVRVQLDKSKCVGPFECGECLEKCPAAAFVTFPKSRERGNVCDHWEIAVDSIFCWGCGVCIDICPKNAITIKALESV